MISIDKMQLQNEIKKTRTIKTRYRLNFYELITFLGFKSWSAFITVRKDA